MLSLTILALSLVAISSSAAPITPSNQVIFIDHATSADKVRAALKKSEIIPDVLDDFSPTVYLSLSYPSAHKLVDLGNSISPSHVSSAPAFEIHSFSSPSDISPTRTLASNISYTLVLTDPDATSRADPAMAEMCHYIVTGITLTSSNASSGLEENDGYALVFSPTLTSANVTELISYLAPSPPPKTGYHRYVFALLAPASDGGRKLKKPQDRPHWGYGKVGKGLRDWASENDLVTVGANFFYAQNKKQ